MMEKPLTAPFPYFGGKRRVAAAVWERFGDVPNYVEPFCGSCAMLLARTTPPRVETLNDVNALLANFWRAVQLDPDGVAAAADRPVSELDMIAIHRWLLSRTEIVEAMKTDLEYYDAKAAGYWLYRQCTWIGCIPDRPAQQLPHIGGIGMCVNSKLPHIGGIGRGVNSKLPHLSDIGMGVNSKLPHFANAGRREFIFEWMRRLSDRLRDVRICCGDWSRVCGGSVVGTKPRGSGRLPCAIFLDPPYGQHVDRDMHVYGSHDDGTVSRAVRDWAVEHGDDPMLRIALCGYDGEHEMPGSWECFAWKAAGGYASQGDGRNKNAQRERIWFSPHCIHTELDLFSDGRVYR